MDGCTPFSYSRMKKIKVLFAIVCLFIGYVVTNAQTSIQMEEYNGVYRIPCTVNGAKMKLVFDTGASNVCLSMSMAEYLYDNGFIGKEDIIGNGTSTVADGRIVDHVVINIKDIEIQGNHLYNVSAVVVDGQNAPLLMGQSAIQKLGTIELSGSLLIIKNGNNDNDLVDNLFKEAFSAYQNQLYGKAAEKYAQLYSMKQLSDYGIYLYAWSCYMSNDEQRAEEVLKSISDFSYFEKEKLDIYWLIASVKLSLCKYDEAIAYYELSGKKIPREKNEYMSLFRAEADCYKYAEIYSKAADYYRYAVLLFAKIHNVDIPYLQRDSKNKLKKKEVSYRNDDIDYLLFNLFFCNERSGSWTADDFLMEAAAMAKAGNKYAKKMLNDAGIDPYDDSLQ